MPRRPPARPGCGCAAPSVEGASAVDEATEFGHGDVEGAGDAADGGPGGVGLFALNPHQRRGGDPRLVRESFERHPALLP